MLVPCAELCALPLTVAAQTGDAAVHQSSLLHGVRVESGTRWSWIMWLKNARDAAECPDVDSKAWTADAAASGDAVAAFIHARRVAVPQQRAHWLRVAAEAGLARAANEFGMALRQGDGVARNETAARTWLTVAAAAGEPDALYNLGLLAAEAGDERAALRLFHEAAVAGSSAAAFNVGAALYSGRAGLARDLDLAAAWFVRAGDGQGLYLAGLIAEAGTPVTPPSASEATRLIRAAAQTGHGQAAMHLANDALAANNEADAAYWLRIAVQSGAEGADKVLRSLSSRAEGASRHSRAGGRESTPPASAASGSQVGRAGGGGASEL